MKPMTDFELALLDKQLAYMENEDYFKGNSSYPEYCYNEVAAIRERLRVAEYFLQGNKEEYLKVIHGTK